MTTKDHWDREAEQIGPHEEESYAAKLSDAADMMEMIPSPVLMAISKSVIKSMTGSDPVKAIIAHLTSLGIATAGMELVKRRKAARDKREREC